MAAVCLAALIVALLTRKIRLAFPSVMVPAVLFILLAWGLSLYGGGPAGLWRRAAKLLWFLLVPVTVVLLRGEVRRARGVILALILGATVLGVKDLILYPLLAARKPMPDFLTALIDKGSMADGQILMLGTVLTVVWLVVSRQAGERLPWWSGAVLAAEVGGLIINFKRGSWFCALLLLGCYLLPRLRMRAWLAVLAATAVFFMLPPVQARMSQLGREFNVEGGGRLTMWAKIAPALIRENPQGIGYGCLTNARMKAIDRKVEPNRNHLHSNVVQVLVETGWAGLGLYLVWMGFWIRDAARRRREATGAGAAPRLVASAGLLLCAGLLLNGLVEYNFGDTEMMFIYAFAMGLAASPLGAAASPPRHLDTPREVPGR